METTNEKNRLAQITIPVTGMSCASCVRRVEGALNKNEGVAEASVNYNPAATNPEELVGAIRDAGYGADVRETTFGVTGMTCTSSEYRSYPFSDSLWKTNSRKFNPLHPKTRLRLTMSILYDMRELNLQEAYDVRPIRFLELWREAGWTLKV